MIDFTQQCNDALKAKFSPESDNEYTWQWYWCWEVNAIHFEVNIHTQLPMLAMMIQACLFYQTSGHEYGCKETACFDLKHAYQEETFHRSPTQCVVWGINQTKRRNIFTFQICCISKAPLSVGYASHKAGRQRFAQGEMTQVTNGWLGICSARKPIITGNMRVSQL